MVYGIQGYGKTTLVSGWLRDQPTDVVVTWVSARPSNGDVDLFAAHVLAELDAEGLVAAAPGPAADAATAPVDALLIRLTSVLRASRDAQFVLVIDDAQWLLDDTLMRGLIGLAARFELFHLVACSRSRHPIQLLATGVVDLEVVPARDLLLSAAQIGELATRMGVHLTLAQARELHQAFGGWMAAVLLVLSEVKSMPDSADRRLPLGRVKHYLREVVLPGIGDRRLLERVMQLSLAERLSHRLIEDMAREEGHDPRALVRLVESPGLAERRYERDDVVLVLPTFIRDGLRATYTASHPEKAKATHRRLARWYAAGSDHDPVPALRHAVAAQDWETLRQLWSRHSADLMFNHAKALTTLLDTLPEDVITSRGSLLVAQEVLRSAGAGQDRELLVALRAYGESSRRVAKRGWDGLELHDLLFVGTGCVVAERLDGRFAEAELIADETERRADALMARGDEPGDLLAWFHLQRALTHTLRADHVRAAHHYGVSWQHRRQTPAVIAEAAAANLALTHALLADLAASTHWLDCYHSVRAENSWGHEFACVGALVAEALLALDHLEPARSKAALDALRREAAPLDLWPIVAHVNAKFSLHYGEPAAALAELDIAQRAYPSAVAHGPAAELLLSRARADLLLAAGQGQRARTLLADHNAEAQPLLAVPLVRLHLLAGDPQQARSIAARLLWDGATDRRARLELWLLHALASQREGDLHTSADMTRRSLAMYRHTRQLRPFATIPRADLQAMFDIAGLTLPFADLTRVMRHRNPFRREITLVQFTPREHTLLNALMTGATRQQIADQLYVSVNTVRSQLTTLYRKLGVTKREDALTRIAEYGLDRPGWGLQSTVDGSSHHHT